MCACRRGLGTMPPGAQAAERPTPGAARSLTPNESIGGPLEAPDRRRFGHRPQHHRPRGLLRRRLVHPGHHHRGGSARHHHGGRSPATTTEAAPPATTTAASSASSSGGPNLTAPSGAQQLESDSKSGAQYTRYSISGTAASAVTSDYQSQLESQGYKITNSGGSGGGWGKWGGSEAGVSGNNGSTYVDVQAGGQSGGPTYFEVCVGPSNTSVQDCEDASDGPDDDSKSS